MANPPTPGESCIANSLPLGQSKVVNLSPYPWGEGTRGVSLDRSITHVGLYQNFFQSLETLDNGKPINDAINADLALVIKCYRYYAGWTDKIQGKTIPIGKHEIFS